MNDRQRDYFRAKLLAWKDEILRESRITLQTLQEENVNHPDLADRASSETDRAIELRARDRQRKLISKIDAALQRIEDITYGYCEETGEPISLKRLEARPIATLSVEAQERHEKREKVYRDEEGQAAACGLFVEKTAPHGEERGTRVSNHEARCLLILRDAARMPLLPSERECAHPRVSANALIRG